MEEHGDADVWSNFEKSVAYMNEVASLYESVFGCKSSGPSSSKKTVTKVHLDEAHNQAQQALELLASNLLNASMTLINSIEKQESEADRLKDKMSTIRQTIRDRQAVLDQEAIGRFYLAHKSSRTKVSLPTLSAQNTARCQSKNPQRTLSSLYLWG
ncbi:Hypothetical protein PHPALM_18821 [Phytophthora palmivora]|uniref:Uncharacterized protein n=1 Tax=Phytophthora palmivora TaxID=4796 RepID=A0A2P4XIT1_9STRA|nr:Hypothetical protein PHPALM_18821 [Phytophthora palmivora]